MIVFIYLKLMNGPKNLSRKPEKNSFSGFFQLTRFIKIQKKNFFWCFVGIFFRKWWKFIIFYLLFFEIKKIFSNMKKSEISFFFSVFKKTDLFKKSSCFFIEKFFLKAVKIEEIFSINFFFWKTRIWKKKTNRAILHGRRHKISPQLLQFLLFNR